MTLSDFPDGVAEPCVAHGAAVRVKLSGNGPGGGPVTLVVLLKIFIRGNSFMKALIPIIFTCVAYQATLVFCQEQPQSNAPAVALEQTSTPKSPPPEAVTLTSIDAENRRGRIQQTFWEMTQSTTGGLTWVSKTVEKEVNFEVATLYAIGGKKRVKGADAVASLQNKLPMTMLICRDGKDLDGFYESIYRPGTIVVVLPQ